MASKNLFIHHACHRLSHQRFGILHGQQIFCQRLTVAARAAARQVETAAVEKRAAMASEFMARMEELAGGFTRSSSEVAETARTLSTTADETARQALAVTGAAEKAADNVQVVDVIDPTRFEIIG